MRKWLIKMPTSCSIVEENTQLELNYDNGMFVNQVRVHDNTVF